MEGVTLLTFPTPKSACGLWKSVFVIGRYIRLVVGSCLCCDWCRSHLHIAYLTHSFWRCNQAGGLLCVALNIMALGSKTYLLFNFFLVHLWPQSQVEKAGVVTGWEWQCWSSSSDCPHEHPIYIFHADYKCTLIICKTPSSVPASLPCFLSFFLLPISSIFM